MICIYKYIYRNENEKQKIWDYIGNLNIYRSYLLILIAKSPTLKTHREMKYNIHIFGLILLLKINK